jgi:hypothetical protein
MLRVFLSMAFQSPGRQQAFRRMVVAHIGLMGILLLTQGGGKPGEPSVALGLALLVAGIVEGAVLIGWRLTQLPKSQALEFLLVTPLRPRQLFFAESLVGLLRLALTTLVGLPILVLLATDGRLDVLDIAVLILMPFTWGAATGLGLTMWAYESMTVRRWGERILVGMLVVSLTVGALAGEKLRQWIGILPEDAGRYVLLGLEAFHRYNPFAVMTFWLKQDALVAMDQMIGVEIAALVAVVLFLVRGARRLQTHFHEIHYQPSFLRSERGRGRPGDRPLAWWAVRRVSRYSGRINLWLAGGFGVMYALYTIAGDQWPAWLGRRVFWVCDNVGGLPSLATALTVLAAVPAAFQYGLWDSNAQERCRRLEMLLLTKLSGRDYWGAAAAAAWKRGRGYFATALLLWTAGFIAGQLSGPQAIAAAATGVLLWALYFTLGFRAFARGFQANGMGMLLTVGLPLLAFLSAQAGLPMLAAVVPPGGVQAAGQGIFSMASLSGALLCGAITLCVGRHALLHCESDLRAWYERRHGSKALI